MAKQNGKKRKSRDSLEEDKNEIIQEWREERQRKMNARKPYGSFYVHSFSLKTLRSFAQNINFMVLFQMTCAAIAVYIFQTYNIWFDLHVTLFVSPIVFPLAFSINTDFQRREKVLEDLAQFKSSGMIWYFCMRDWKQAARLDNEWFSIVHAKRRSVLFHIREFLLTYKPVRRKVILRAIYEDFSDMNQLIEKLRASKLPANTAIISRSIHLVNMMCLSFERLRVIREYRSPRSIRSFNKVLIMILPIILSPYFVHIGFKSDSKWEPYFISILVAFVFSALQGVQDKLDDPFDGMSEDDIQLDTFDEWNSSLEYVMRRKVYSTRRIKDSLEKYYNQFKTSFDETLLKKRHQKESNDTQDGSRALNIYQAKRDLGSLVDLDVDNKNKSNAASLSPTDSNISNNDSQVNSPDRSNMNYEQSKNGDKKKMRHSRSWNKPLVNKDIKKDTVPQKYVKQQLFEMDSNVVRQVTDKKISVDENKDYIVDDKCQVTEKLKENSSSDKLSSKIMDSRFEVENNFEHKFVPFTNKVTNSVREISHDNESPNNQNLDAPCSNTVNYLKENLHNDRNCTSSNGHVDKSEVQKALLYFNANVNKQPATVSRCDVNGNDLISYDVESCQGDQHVAIPEKLIHSSPIYHRNGTSNNQILPEKNIRAALDHNELKYLPLCLNNLKAIPNIGIHVAEISKKDVYKLETSNSTSSANRKITITSNKFPDELSTNNKQLTTDILTNIRSISSENDQDKEKMSQSDSGIQDQAPIEAMDHLYNQTDSKDLVTTTWNLMSSNMKRKIFANGCNFNNKDTRV